MLSGARPSAPPTGVAKRFPGSLRVPDDARWYALSDLYGGGSQMDEPLNEPGLRQTN
jgi:hypothetical protein